MVKYVEVNEFWTKASTYIGSTGVSVLTGARINKDIKLPVSRVITI